jgi:hypothetical protein
MAVKNLSRKEGQEEASFEESNIGKGIEQWSCSLTKEH